MTNPIIKEVNVETGEEIEREMTTKEVAQWKTDAVKASELLALEQEAQIAKLAAQAKLAELGLTTDDLKALGL